MKHKALSLVLLFFVLFFLHSSPAEAASIPEAALPRGLNSEVLFTLVNNHRIDVGLTPLVKDKALCEVAKSRLPELDREIYVTRQMHKGFHDKNLNYRAVENMISQQTEKAALNWWLNSSIHRRSIEGSYRFSCMACKGNSCTQIFTNFDPKQHISVSNTKDKL